MDRNQSIRLKSLLLSILPPILVPPVRWLRDRISMPKRPPEWEYVPEGWSRARIDPRVKGFNVNAVREANRAIWPKWIKALEGNATLGLDYWASIRAQQAEESVIVRTDGAWAHNTVMSYAYSLALAARMKDKVSILDWGGGVGQYYRLSKALLPGVEIAYHCKDVPVLCDLGRELSPEVHFYEDESWREQHYDFVVTSAAFQFSENWPETLRQLASATAGYLLINRVPLVFQTPSFVVLQRGYGYCETEFLGWFLNREEFLQRASAAGVRLIREFVIMDSTPAHRAPEQADYRGFLFQLA